MTDRSRADFLLLGTIAKLVYDDDLAVDTPVRIGEVVTDYILVRKETNCETGAGRGLWPPAGQGSAWRCGRGDGPCHCSGESAFAPPAAGTRCNQDRYNPRHGGPAPAGQGWHRSLSCPWGAFFGDLQPKDPEQSASCITPPALRPFSDRR
jgi:hypothetical protein